MKRLLLTSLIVLAGLAAGQAQQRLLGGDLSLLPSYADRGTVYRDAKGRAVEPLAFLKENRWNAVRVRLFTDPTQAPDDHKDEGVCQDLDYVVRLARQVKEAGMQFMLDFHYSDTWADPSKQFTPAAWQGLSPEAMADSVYAHTRRSLEVLRREGLAPELVQVGNEITNGMLWPTGKINPATDEGWPTLARLLAAGCRAVRETCPEARIIIHTERAGETQLTLRYYHKLDSLGLDYDIIGLSYYPMWHKSVSNLGITLNALSRDFPSREVMIVETAAYYSHENDPWATADMYSEFYPITPRGQEQFTKELVAELRRHPNVTGLFWWFAEENASGEAVTRGWLNRGLFDNKTGRAMPALRALRRFAK